MISCGSGCLPMSCHHTSAYPVRPKARRTRGTNRPAWRLIVKGSVRDACGSNRRWHTCRDLRAPHVKVLVALARVVRVEARGALSRAATHDVLAVHVARRRRPRRPQPQEPGQSHHVPLSAGCSVRRRRRGCFKTDGTDAWLDPPQQSSKYLLTYPQQQGVRQAISSACPGQVRCTASHRLLRTGAGGTTCSATGGRQRCWGRRWLRRWRPAARAAKGR